jgi:hypothetical protein
MLVAELEASTAALRCRMDQMGVQGSSEKKEDLNDNKNIGRVNALVKKILGKKVIKRDSSHQILKFIKNL